MGDLIEGLPLMGEGATHLLWQDEETVVKGGAMEAVGAVSPVYALRATTSGVASPAETGVRAAYSPEGLHFLFITPPGQWLRAGESVAALIDPVGDQEGFFEIGVNVAGVVQSAVLRRSRSGYKRNAAWQCLGASAEVSLGKTYDEGEGDATVASGRPWLAHLFIPFSTLVDHLPVEGERWGLNFQRTHSIGVKSTLERLPLFSVALF